MTVKYSILYNMNMKKAFDVCMFLINLYLLKNKFYLL